MALGAFLAGMVVGRSEFSVRAATDALPMRDAFAVLFFVSVGMLFDPGHLVEAPLLVAAALAIVLLGKPLAALAIAWLLNYPLKVGLSLAVALAQIGEFSFIVGHLGTTVGVLDAAGSNTIIACAIISITLNPLLYRCVTPVSIWLSKSARTRTPSGTDGLPSDAAEPRHHAVVVGYGPIGRTVARLLHDNDISPTIVEMNVATVTALRAKGIDAVYGDATHPATLQAAGIERARSVILSVAGMEGAAEAIRVSRELNPNVQVLARTGYIREQDALRRAGADRVFSGEAEVALAFTESILANLGATSEQIDRERSRVHDELG
jgi:CPA2 family monovalent cation:H+ antiporter-2